MRYSSITSMASSDNGTQRLTGMVKWFNNKSGFGFITVFSSGEYKGKDIFAHYSSIRVTNSQYKYLVQGEYVDFLLVHSEKDKHEYQATDITGVMNGPIMCETRREAQSAQLERPTNVQTRREAPSRRQVRPASPAFAPTEAESSA
jgi:CspA family cold shock protein